MIDLMPALNRVARCRATWSMKDAALVALTVLTKSRQLHVDWDHGAGERWIRLIAGSDVLVLVSTTVPIAFAVAPAAIWLDEMADRVEVVATVSLDTAQYKCNEGPLESLFQGSTASLGFSASSFSVMDLYYATV